MWFTFSHQVQGGWADSPSFTLRPLFLSSPAKLLINLCVLSSLYRRIDSASDCTFNVHMTCFIYLFFIKAGRTWHVDFLSLFTVDQWCCTQVNIHTLAQSAEQFVCLLHTHTLAHTSVLLWTWSEKLRIRSNVLYTPKVMWFYSLLCGVNGVSKLLSWMHQCVHMLFVIM